MIINYQYLDRIYMLAILLLVKTFDNFQACFFLYHHIIIFYCS